MVAWESRKKAEREMRNSLVVFSTCLAHLQNCDLVVGTFVAVG
jgi:hypothetical protein